MVAVDDTSDTLIDRFWEYESQRESEEDLSELSGDSIREAVVSATDWTTETLIGQISKGNIQLSPQFQRRDAWRQARKSRFVESLILGLPIPQVVLAESKTQRGTYIVLDGKQRLLSICQFAAKKGSQPFEQLRLKALEIREDLNGLTLEDMQRDLAFSEDVASFENQAIRTVVIKNWPNENFLYHVFLRLNTNSVMLSPQELRQALHPGPFVQFAEEESRSNKALRDILGQTRPDFRMRDTELLVRFFAFQNFLLAYKGNLKAFLDKSCERLNSDWDERQDELVWQLSQFNEAHSAVRQVFGADAYHKWAAGSYESRFNRAIFDVMIFAFFPQGSRDVLVNDPVQVRQLFQQLCEMDADFLASIETTTKSMSATASRYGRWADTVNKALGTELPVLHLDDDHGSLAF